MKLLSLHCKLPAKFPEVNGQTIETKILRKRNCAHRSHRGCVKYTKESYKAKSNFTYQIIKSQWNVEAEAEEIPLFLFQTSCWMFENTKKNERLVISHFSEMDER